MEHILGQENGKDRYLQGVRELAQAFALSVPHPEALAIRDDLAFFQAISAQLGKRRLGKRAATRRWSRPSGRLCRAPLRQRA